MSDPARENPPLSVAAAKANLLEFGDRTSREWRETFEVAQSRAKHAVPWVAIAAAGLGLTFGRRRKRRRGSESVENAGGRGLGSTAIWLVKTFAPLAVELLGQRRSSPKERPRSGGD